jgi:hypothetical protein
MPEHALHCRCCREQISNANNLCVYCQSLPDGYADDKEPGEDRRDKCPDVRCDNYSFYCEPCEAMLQKIDAELDNTLANH